MELLPIDSTDGFLHLEDLPHNCIFNKVVTGCGGTTVVLKNAEDYIIAVPTTELIINKTGRTDAGTSILVFGDAQQSIFGLFGKFDSVVERELKDYLSNRKIKKIICTYDKIPKLLEYIKPADYRLLIDEYHTLLKAYAYRAKAIDGVLSNFRRFKSFCFMSATPILPEFKPECLSDIEEKEADWGELDKMRIALKQTNKPYVLTANIINAYKTDGYLTADGIKSREAFFFINSVKDIAAILKHCNLSNDEVRIICADTDENHEKLIGYDISNSRSPNKMFNFITSKSFEGADYFSDTGLCFVVSSSTNPHTLASIDTDIPQIAGRIRTKDNPFRNLLIHIFNTSHKKINLEITYEEMKAITEKALHDTKDTVSFFNEAPPNVKDNLRNKLRNSLNKLYMGYDSGEDKFVVNDILPKLELYNFQINQIIYKDGASISKHYEEKGMGISRQYIKVDGILSTLTKKMNFKDAFLQYAAMASKHPNAPALYFLEQQQPLVRDAYEKLGEKKVRKLRYVKKSIEAALECLDTDKTIEQKIAQMMVGLIPTGKIITVAYANEQMRLAYQQLGIPQKTVKAKDLHEWFECSDPFEKRIDGKPTKVVEIYRTKIIFNQ